MNKSKLTKILIMVGIPTLYAIVLRLFFGITEWNDFFTVMSVSFLLCLPTIVGALTIYFSSEENAKKFWYRFFVPWIPILVFFVITLLVSLEGWACWLMILPLFLLAATFGGLIGGYFKLRKRDNKVYISHFYPFSFHQLKAWLGQFPELIRHTLILT